MINQEIVDAKLRTIESIKSLFMRIDDDTTYTTAGIVEVLDKLERAFKVSLFDTERAERK
jgi:hypothetical protein